jgi:hypothetical protein
MFAADLYRDCLTIPWPAVHAALARLDTLTHAEARAAYQSLGFATPYRSRRQAIESIRLRVVMRKGAYDRATM